MNAGGHGSQTTDRVVAARVVDLRARTDRTVGVGDLALAYRHSAVRPDEIVVSASFALSFGDAAESAAAIAEIVAWRRANQPAGRNAGSVFQNPPGDSAGRLIEARRPEGPAHRGGPCRPPPRQLHPGWPGCLRRRRLPPPRRGAPARRRTLRRRAAGRDLPRGVRPVNGVPTPPGGRLPGRPRAGGRGSRAVSGQNGRAAVGVAREAGRRRLRRGVAVAVVAVSPPGFTVWRTCRSSRRVT